MARHPNPDLIVPPAALAARLGDPAVVVVDCRFSLADPAGGAREHAAGHVPDAVYAHLDDDLSGPIVPGATGRHPLPAVDAFATTLGAWGIGDGTHVVAYDDMGGAIAARLWWMLRWLGHDAAAVLDGGWPRWVAEGHPVSTDAARPRPATFTPRPRPGLVIDAAAVERLRRREPPAGRLLDARGADRFRGLGETIDPVAGHIPGAVPAPFADNLAPDGRFLPPAALRARFEGLLAGTPPSEAAVYCGSGVTAAHDVLAMAVAGLDLPRLYAGSWSEWITDPKRPVATGDA